MFLTRRSRNAGLVLAAFVLLSAISAVAGSQQFRNAEAGFNQAFSLRGAKLKTKLFQVKAAYRSALRAYGKNTAQGKKCLGRMRDIKLFLGRLKRNRTRKTLTSVMQPSAVDKLAEQRERLQLKANKMKANAQHKIRRIQNAHQRLKNVTSRSAAKRKRTWTAPPTKRTKTAAPKTRTWSVPQPRRPSTTKRSTPPARRKHTWGGSSSKLTGRAYPVARPRRNSYDHGVFKSLANIKHYKAKNDFANNMMTEGLNDLDSEDEAAADKLAAKAIYGAMPRVGKA